MFAREALASAGMRLGSNRSIHAKSHSRNLQAPSIVYSPRAHGRNNLNLYEPEAFGLDWVSGDCRIGFQGLGELYEAVRVGFS